MSLHVVLHPEAETEAQPTIALRFEATLERALRDVGDAPERWPMVSRETRERTYLLARPFNSWMLIYRIDGSVVTVVAVAHGKREPAFWRGRE